MLQMSFVSYLCVVVVENKESDERHYMLPIKVTLVFFQTNISNPEKYQVLFLNATNQSVCLVY